MTIRRITTVAVAIILLVAFFFAFSWFFVRGAELRFLQDIPSDCTATVTKDFWSFDSGTAERKNQEFTLTQEQLAQILALLQSSSYWRILSSSISNKEAATYSIFITYTRNGITRELFITSLGGYAVVIFGSSKTPYDYQFLRIRNKEWVTLLDTILES